jgi:hypothetical protein
MDEKTLDTAYTDTDLAEMFDFLKSQRSRMDLFMTISDMIDKITADGSTGFGSVTVNVAHRQVQLVKLEESVMFSKSMHKKRRAS